MQDEAANRMRDEDYNALIKIGAQNPIKNDFRSSYALVGYSGPGRPSWVTQVRRSASKLSVTVAEVCPSSLTSFTQTCACNFKSPEVCSEEIVK